MKKNTKIILVLLLVLVAFSGCGGSRDDDSGRSYYGDYSSYYGTSSKEDTSSKDTSKNSSSTTSNDMKIYSFSVAKIGIPKEYASQLAVVKKSESGKTYNVLLRVYEKTSKLESEMDMDESLGLLFEIGYTKISKFSSMSGQDYPNSKVFAKDSNNYYIYTEPSDYQFYRSDGGTATEEKNWQKLQKIGDTVKSHFLKINDAKSCTTKIKDSDENANNYSSKHSTSSYVTSQKCSLCKGSGACNHCVFGHCPSCNGKGRFDCITCIGMGDCGSCGGSGYTYRGTGLNFKKVQCSRCNGSGDCRSCGGRRYDNCAVCGSTGNCSICDGTALCSLCNGTGKR